MATQIQTKSSVSSVVCVPSKDTAIEIADVICKSVYPDIDFSKYNANANYQNHTDMWEISYTLISVENQTSIGGGGPALIINSKTAEVIEIYLQK